MQHHKMIGVSILEVDHFNPNLTPRWRNKYENLFPATRHSNGAKSNNWPTPGERRKGLRFLNCCEEQDYGKHIFEDPKTHQLIGVTPAGRYHIKMCDLNAPHYTRERADRDALRKFIEGSPIKIRGNLAEFSEAMQRVREHLDLLIPPIPAP